MANNWELNLLGKLDENKSKSQINQDIQAIQRTLNSVELKAVLSPDQIKDLESQLNKLQVSLTDVTISQSVLNNLVNSINNALQGVQLNINPRIIGGGSGNVGNAISNELHEAIKDVSSTELEVGFHVDPSDSDKFEQEVSQVIKDLQSKNATAISYRLNTYTDTDENSGESIEHLKSATFQYTTATGEAIRKTIEFNEAQKVWIESSATYSKTLNEASSGVDSFIDKQKKAVASAENVLSVIESELHDSNATKSLANTDFDANGLNAQLDLVRNSIISLGNASKDTFTQAQIDTEREITALKNLIKQLKNAEYVATSLRSKTFDTVKRDEINNFEPFYQELLKSSAVDSNGVSFKDRAETLHQNILGASSSNDITRFLNEASNLRTEYKSVKKQADDTAKSVSLLAKKSEALSSLHIFTNANPDVEKFTTVIGNTTISVKELEDAINNASSSSELTSAKEQMKAFQRAAEDAGKATKATTTEYEILLKKANEAINTNKYSGATSSVKTNYEKLDDSVIDKSLKDDYERLINLSNKLNSSMADDEKVKTYREIEKLLPSVKNRIAEISEISNIKFSYNNGDDVSEYNNRIRKIEQDFIKYGVSVDEVKKKTKLLHDILEGFKDNNGNILDDDKLIAQANLLEKEFKSVKVALDGAKLSFDKFTQPVSSDKASSLIVRINSFLGKNTNITKVARVELENFVRQLNNGVDLSEWNRFNNRLKEIENEMRVAGRLGKSLKQTLSEGAKSFLLWTISSASVMDVINLGREVAENVYEIDTAMTNLYKVTDETDEVYNRFLDNACDKAKELGRSVSSLITQTAEWSKLGFSLEEAESLSKVSSIYANVAEVDDKTAVSDLVTAMKAFKIEAKDAILIADKLNALGNKYALSASDLGEGLSNSASALSLAGNSIDETLAMITAMTEITQDASESGNALKILSMRLRGMKGELQALGEESDGIESISKIQTQILNLTGGKVNIFDNAGNFKSTYEIMKGISEVWTEISETDQATLLEIIAGKQRGNSISALLTNMAQANKALNDSIESGGSAYEEQSRWMESLEADFCLVV